jgi:hypothetical protein
MMIEPLEVSKPIKYKFQNNMDVEFHYKQERREGAFFGDLVVQKSGLELILFDAVDDGQTVNSPTLAVILGEPLNVIRTFGGQNSYKISSSLEILEKTTILRHRDYEEYWTAQFMETNFGIVVVYESGIMLINRKLDIVWHQSKYFNESVKLSGSELNIVEDSGKSYYIRISDGIRQKGT